MKKLISIAIGAAAVMAVASLVAHRRVIMACVKGEPAPEPPEWHKHCKKAKKD